LSEYDWLDSYESEYKAQKAFRPGFDTLPEGDYELAVTDAAFDQIGGKPVVRVVLQVLPAGACVERVYWVERQQEMNSLCADLLTLGFPANTWGAAHGKPLKVELPRALSALIGYRIRARKTTRQGTGTNAGKVFPNLDIACRVTGTTAPMPPVPPVMPPPGGQAQAVHIPEDVPF
jgi:hypothetical protein